MSEECPSCKSEIVSSGFRKHNSLISQRKIRIINFATGSEHRELCEKCGNPKFDTAIHTLKDELQRKKAYILSNIADFPMMTLTQLPMNSMAKIRGLVTANVTVGTGFFNEISQEWSDFRGATNIKSGMASKINSGEATARCILIDKTIAYEGNCIVGIDIDYGTTVNNAAIINMQGTATKIANLESIFDNDQLDRFEKFMQYYVRVEELSKLLSNSNHD